VNPGALLVHEGHLLAGTLDDGLLVCELATRRWSSARVPLGTRNVTSILWTADALWIGTGDGIIRVARTAEVLS
jgi:ligand-binding sensor domain-containing protein